MKKYINYQNASIDVTKEVVKNLKINDYKKNSQKENFELVKNGLENYSLKKLTEFGKETKNHVNHDLNGLFKDLDNCIVEDKDKKEFFKQYSHCIIQLIGELRGQNQITWIRTELDTDIDIIFSKDEKEIKTILTSDKLEYYQVPAKIIDEYEKKVLTR